MAKSAPVVEETAPAAEAGIYEGLAAIRKYKADQEARKAAAEANKINWLKIDENETIKVWILQELDRGAEGYHEELGIGIMATEHTNPENWRRKALCSASEDSACLGCEKHKEDWRAGWKQKSRIYLNVLVERANGDREVAVMSQANGPKSVIGPMILEYAVEENTITNRWFKITKTGKDTSTAYTFFPGKESTEINPLDYADQIHDLRKAVRAVPYEEQFDFYFQTDSSDKAEEAPAAPARSPWPSDNAGANEEW